MERRGGERASLASGHRKSEKSSKKKESDDWFQVALLALRAVIKQDCVLLRGRKQKVFTHTALTNEVYILLHLSQQKPSFTMLLSGLRWATVISFKNCKNIRHLDEEKGKV